MQNNLQEFISNIPKSDLHVHLDGSIRIETLIELSKRAKLPLPSYTVEGLNELVFKDQYNNLVEYLNGFALISPAMQTPENLERISYEFAKDNIAEGVSYVEVRFAPHLHINDKQNIDEVLLSVNRGLDKAKQEYNQKPEVKSKTVPEFNYGIIVCAMRYFTKGFSKFLDHVLTTHQNLNLNSIVAITSYDLVKACVQVRDKYNLPIVAFDLAGEEADNPPIHHRDAYHFAHKNFMHLTVHAGESTGPDMIFQAVTELYPERIGHGFYLFSKNEIADPEIKGKDEYIRKLVEYIADRRTTIEVCLTSNLQTIPTIKEIKNHSFSKMLKANLSTTICTDNRTISKTNVTKELMLAIQNFNLDKNSLKDLIINGFKRSFYPGSYEEKLDYIRQIRARYDFLVKQYCDVL
ncbi:MAG: adenosine deaminase family protein [Gammaproteobacteria bacterium]|nr:adenosine deaminase family protein [Gammaproteobacteria bacterium]